MIKNFKQIVILMCTVIAVMCLLSLSISAKSDTLPEAQTEYNGTHASINSGTSTMALEDEVDLASFRKYLFEQLKSCLSTIDISSFKIPSDSDNVNGLIEYIYYEMPEAFNVDSLKVASSGGYCIKIYVTYKAGIDTEDTYLQKYNEMVESAEILLDGIKDNSKLDDVEKALLLHDRLAVWNEYDFSLSRTFTHTAYGALAERTSVCQGYAMAYMFLLNQVGIESDYCQSETMNHGWNIVYINNIPYHVDVTHDDSFHMAGKVAHNNFLVSTEKYKSNNHNANDFDSTPKDTRYDNGVWNNSTASFQLIDSVVYFVDNENKSLNKYDNGVSTKLIDVEETIGYYFTGFPQNQACFASNGTELFFSSSKDVYSYNPATKIKTKIFSPDSVTSKNLIYAITYENDELICHLSTDLNTFTTEKYSFGNIYDGWYQLGNIWYYYIDGQKATGWLELEGYKYYFDENGVMSTGWTLVDETWYYFTLGGQMATGWQYINGYYYYMNTQGEMQTGWRLVDGSWFYLNQGGVLCTGWQYIDGQYYYFNDGGFMQTGWVLVDGTWYYFTPGGQMATGWQYINGYYYYMDSNGMMQTGWRLVDGSWFYLNQGGVLCTGWQYIDGQYYYFNDGGFMQTGTILINGTYYTFNSSGVWVG